MKMVEAQKVIDRIHSDKVVPQEMTQQLVG